MESIYTNNLIYKSIQVSNNKLFKTYFKSKGKKLPIIIYQMIFDSFGLFDVFYNYDVLIIDKTFSGLYKITPENVLSIMNFHRDEYKPMWEEFICSLSEVELRQLLFSFGNTLSTSEKYNIYINSDINTAINITTCFHTITIHERLFEHKDYLNSLKYYFKDNDQISDGIIDNNEDEEYEEDNSNIITCGSYNIGNFHRYVRITDIINSLTLRFNSVNNNNFFMRESLPFTGHTISILHVTDTSTDKIRTNIMTNGYKMSSHLNDFTINDFTTFSPRLFFR